MIIDAHTHMFHSKYLKQIVEIGGDWAEKKVNRILDGAQRKPHFIDVALRLEMLDRNGIELQVVTPPLQLDSNLLPGDAAAKLAMARVVNDSMARLMDESKGRLIAAGTVPLTGFEPDGRQEMDRAIKALGLKAINLSSNILGKALDLPEFEPFWAQAAEMGVPIYIHPVDPAGQTDRNYEAEYDLTHNFGWPFETILTLSRLV
ncbi:amidohydrolase family protein, partial [Chloroflexota bacterium]